MNGVTAVDSHEVMARFQAELRLVDTVAGQVQREIGNVLDHDELVSFGQEGLLLAARRYDPDRGIAFRTYAYHRVRGAMLDGMRSHGGLSRRLNERVKALQAAHLMASGYLEDNQAATRGGLSPEAADDRLSDQLAALATAMAVGFEGQETSLQEGERVLVAADDPGATAERSELMRAVHEALSCLTDQEAVLVRRHFLREERIEDVAADLGLSKSWGSRLLTRGIEKLSKQLREDV